MPSSIEKDIRAIEYKKAYHLMQVGRYDLAIDAMGRLLGQFPEESQAFIIIAHSYLNTEKPREALAAIQEALRLDGNNCFAHALAGFTLSSLVNWDQAAKEFEIALRIDPESGVTHFWYSIHLLSVGLQIAKAVKHAQKAVELSPESSGFHEELGRAYRAAQRVDEAEKAFRTSLRLNPQNAQCLYDLGCLLLEERNDLTQARFCLSQAVQLAPDDHEIRKAAEGILPEQHSPYRLFRFWYTYRFRVMRRRWWMKPFGVVWGLALFVSIATANAVGYAAGVGLLLVLPLLDTAMEELTRLFGRRTVQSDKTQAVYSGGKRMGW